ncbi:hypothetical protein I552_9522 [Mycobacterium xenopi 3993]|nr:hypothetical protein I552_9522 [Mycobacterium xenopi 3993]
MTCLLAALLGAGCSVVVGGAGRPVAGIAPRPVTGVTIEQALLGTAELEKLLDQSVRALQPPATGARPSCFAPWCRAPTIV